MSVIVFDRHNNFFGLQEVPGQNWLVMDAKELRLVLFEPVTAGFVRIIILLMGELFGLIKSLNLVFEAFIRVQQALRQIPGAAVPTLSHLIMVLRTLSFKDAKPEYIRSALTELNDMHRSVSVIWDHSQSDVMSRLISPAQHTVIRTDELDRNEELFLLAWMLTYCIETGNAKPRSHMIYFIIDEMGLLFDRTAQDSRALVTLRQNVLTARQPRVAIIGGTQMPALIQPELLASAGTLICTGLQDNDNIWQTAKAMGVAHVGH